jgi:uncharacterized protein
MKKVTLKLAGLALVTSASLAAGPVAAQSGTSGPSFSCARVPEGGVEEVICRDPDLSRQDRVLATAFRQARAAVRGSEGLGELLTSQQAWLRVRAECVNLSMPKGFCVETRTKDRIEVLWQWAALKTNPDRAQRQPQKTGTTASSRPPQGPSFNCARATNSVERLICANRSLSILDRQMAGLYDRARYRMPPEMDAMLTTEQRTFLANRNLCARRINDKVECVATAYEMRNLRLNEWLGNGQSN